MDSIVLQLPLADVWSTALGFIALMIVVVGAIGLISRSLAVGAMGAYLTFAYYATATQIQLLETVFIPTLALLAIGVAFKLWRTEAVGEV